MELLKYFGTEHPIWSENCWWGWRGWREHTVLPRKKHGFWGKGDEV